MSRWTGSPDYSCTQCVERTKKHRGCLVEGFGPGTIRTAVGGKFIQECPKSFVMRDDDVKGLFDVWEYYKLREKGFLPTTGGYLEQPWVANELVRLISNEVIRRDNEDAAKREAKGKANGFRNR